MGAAKLDIPSITITSPEQEKSDYSPSDDETSAAYAPNGFIAFKKSHLLWGHVGILVMSLSSQLRE